MQHDSLLRSFLCCFEGLWLPIKGNKCRETTLWQCLFSFLVCLAERHTLRACLCALHTCESSSLSTFPRLALWRRNFIHSNIHRVQHLMIIFSDIIFIIIVHRCNNQIYYWCACIKQCVDFFVLNTKTYFSVISPFALIVWHFAFSGAFSLSLFMLLPSLRPLEGDNFYGIPAVMRKLCLSLHNDTRYIQE